MFVDVYIFLYVSKGGNKLVFGCKDLRYPEEWLGYGWKKMDVRPDILGLILCAIETSS
ncbi:hypothetical protein Hanom_Chr05g00465201 [Helianthus anomalus]